MSNSPTPPIDMNHIVIDSNRIAFRYQTAATAQSADTPPVIPAALDDVTLTTPHGEFVVLCGQSGCGKTTFTRLLNGLIPTFHTGDLTGTCSVYGLRSGHSSIEEYAAVVGSVFQNPKTQYFNAFVADELAFPCENAGWEPSAIRERVQEVAASGRSSGSPWRPPACCGRGCWCSTSRPAAWTSSICVRSGRCCARWPTAAKPCSW